MATNKKRVQTILTDILQMERDALVEFLKDKGVVEFHVVAPIGQSFLSVIFFEPETAVICKLAGWLNEFKKLRADLYYHDSDDLPDFYNFDEEAKELFGNGNK